MQRLLPALTALCLFSSPAHANGRYPSSQLLRVGPGRESRVIALRLSFGFAISEDRGCTFRWLCEQPLGYSGPPYDPPFELAPDGALQLAIANGNEEFNGIFRVNTDRCSVTHTSEVRGQYAVDLSADVTGQNLVAVTSNGASGPPNRVWRSSDGGRSFVPLGAGSRELYTTIELAPSDLQRVYLTAARNDPQRVSLFFRSNDGGATIEAMPFPAGESLQSAYIAGVDPSNADRVYVRGIPMSTRDDAGVANNDGTVLLRTDDGGNRWTEVFRTVAAMEGFALSDDGRTIWIGTPGTPAIMGRPAAPAELQRSTDYGARWTRIGTWRVNGLRFHQGTLYLAANDAVDGFALARSTDNGEHFEPLLRLCDMRVTPPCPATSDFRACEQRWSLQRGPNNLACPNAVGTSAACPLSSDAGRMDAGPPIPPTPVCGCRTTAQRGGAVSWCVMLGALALLRRNRIPRRCQPLPRTVICAEMTEDKTMGDGTSDWILWTVGCGWLGATVHLKKERE